MKQTDSERSARQVWLDHYTRHTSNLLSSLALVYLVTYSIQSIWYEPGTTWYSWLQGFGYLLWVLFAIDLLFRFSMSTMKRHFFKKNLLDTITVVIPQLRALRALRARTAAAEAQAELDRVIAADNAARAALAAHLRRRQGDDAADRARLCDRHRGERAARDGHRVFRVDGAQRL